MIVLYKKNSSGFRGISWVKRGKYWQARFVANGKRIHIGYFSKKSDAINAYRERAKNAWGVFTPLSLKGKEV